MTGLKLMYGLANALQGQSVHHHTW